MLNKCLKCKKATKNKKFCSRKCANRYPKSIKTLRKMSISQSGINSGFSKKYHNDSKFRKKFRKITSLAQKKSFKKNPDRNKIAHPGLKKYHDDKNHIYNDKDFLLKKGKLISKALKKSKVNKGKNNPSYGKVRYPKLFYSKELKHSIRSSWEENICKILKKRNIKYKYEPRYFKVDSKHTYRPDLELDKNIYIEIKGPLYDSQLYKMKKFVKLYSKNKLIIITGNRNFKRLKFFKYVLDYYKCLNDGGEKLCLLLC